jgi:hypothetical protein
MTTHDGPAQGTHRADDPVPVSRASSPERRWKRARQYSGSRDPGAVAHVLMRLGLRYRVQGLIFAYELGLVVVGAQRKPPCTDTPTPRHVCS